MIKAGQSIEVRRPAMRRYLAGVTGSLAGLAMLAGGMAAAPASAAQTRQATAPAVPAAPAVAPARHGHEQFRLTTRSPSARRQTLRATGVLNARGHAVVGRLVSGRGSDALVIAHGSIHLVTIVASIQVSVPTPTCRFTEVYRGAYRIRGGTRRYAAASGSGSYVTKIAGRLKRKNGRCTSALASFSQSTVTSGSLRW
jgi:hypothetical protein